MTLAVTLYGKPGCHLCEEAEQMLARLRRRYPHTLMQVDVSRDPALQERYGLRVPVVVLRQGPVLGQAQDERGDVELGAPLAYAHLEQALAAASRRPGGGPGPVYPAPAPANMRSLAPDGNGREQRGVPTAHAARGVQDVSTAQAAPGVATPLAESGTSPMVWLQVALSALFVVALPLLIISTNLRWLAGDRDLMLAGFQRDRVDVPTRLDQRQLATIADAFARYLTVGPVGQLDVQVEVDGQRRPLLNERELIHMEDVQALIFMFYRVQAVTAVLVLARLAWAAFGERSARDLGRDMLLSAGLMVALVAVVGALSLVDFSELWTRFHYVAFRNNLWLLDPRTDYLIMLFPEPAWLAYTARMVIGVAAVTALTAIAGFGAWRWGR